MSITERIWVGLSAFWTIVMAVFFVIFITRTNWPMVGLIGIWLGLFIPWQCIRYRWAVKRYQNIMETIESGNS